MGVIRMFAAATVGLVSTVAMAADPDQAIRQSLQKIQPDMPIEAVAESPMPGVYQVQLEGGRQLYASADGQFVIQGYLYQFKDGQAVNLTEQAQSRSVAKQINAIPASEMVVFAPKAPKPISPCSPLPIVAIARSCTAKCLSSTVSVWRCAMWRSRARGWAATVPIP